MFNWKIWFRFDSDYYYFNIQIIIYFYLKELLFNFSIPPNLCLDSSNNSYQAICQRGGGSCAPVTRRRDGSVLFPPPPRDQCGCSWQVHEVCLRGPAAHCQRWWVTNCCGQARQRYWTGWISFVHFHFLSLSFFFLTENNIMMQRCSICTHKASRGTTRWRCARSLSIWRTRRIRSWGREFWWESFPRPSSRRPPLKIWRAISRESKLASSRRKRSTTPRWLPLVAPGRHNFVAASVESQTPRTVRCKPVVRTSPWPPSSPAWLVEPSGRWGAFFSKVFFRLFSLFFSFAMTLVLVTKKKKEKERKVKKLRKAVLPCLCLTSLGTSRSFVEVAVGRFQLSNNTCRILFGSQSDLPAGIFFFFLISLVIGSFISQRRGQDQNAQVQKSKRNRSTFSFFFNLLLLPPSSLLLLSSFFFNFLQFSSCFFNLFLLLLSLFWSNGNGFSSFFPMSFFSFFSFLSWWIGADPISQLAKQRMEDCSRSFVPNTHADNGKKRRKEKRCQLVLFLFLFFLSFPFLSSVISFLFVLIASTSLWFGMYRKSAMTM